MATDNFVCFACRKAFAKPQSSTTRDERVGAEPAQLQHAGKFTGIIASVRRFVALASVVAIAGACGGGRGLPIGMKAPPDAGHPPGGIDPGEQLPGTLSYEFRFQTTVPVGLHGPQGTTPGVLATGDFDGDGGADLVFEWALSPSPGIEVALGNKDGTFRAGVALPVGSSSNGMPGAVHVTDGNGDGHSDLYGIEGGTLYFWAGNGDGTFAAPVPVGTTAGSWADLDGDGREDLTFAASANGTLQLSTQRAQLDGTLAAPVTAGSYTTDATTILVADFDGDHHADLTIVGPALTTYKGGGDGTFATTASSTISLAPSSTCSIAGDLDGNHRIDVACVAAGTTQLLPGSSTGLSTGATLPFAATTFADWDGDKKLDAVGDDAWARGVGDGTFAPPTLRPPFAGTFADFDGDGRVDIYGGAATALNGPAGFLSQRTFAVDAASWVQVADLDGDGRLDFVVEGGVTIGAYLQQADGSLVETMNYATSSAAKPAVIADVDGDGVPDIVAMDRTPTATLLVIGRGDGHGGFTWMTTNTPDHSWGTSIGVGDFDGNGAVDVAMAGCGSSNPNTGGCSFNICFNQLVGGVFSCADAVALPSDDFFVPEIAGANLGGDARDELVLFAGGQNGVGMSPGGTYGSWSPWLAGAAPYSMMIPAATSRIPSDGNGSPQMFVTGDVDGDGYSDIVAADGVWYSTRGEVARMGPGSALPDQRVGGDINGDGYFDVIEGRSISLGSPDGLTASTVTGPVGDEMQLVDFDGDGRLDVVQLVSYAGHARIEIARNVPP